MRKKYNIVIIIILIIVAYKVGNNIVKDVKRKEAERKYDYIIVGNNCQCQSWAEGKCKYSYGIKDGVVKEFTSSEKAEELYGVLNELEIYTLHEEKAPEGYLKAKDIKFKIDEEGKVNIYEGEEFKQQDENVIKMKDEKIINPETSNKGIFIIMILVLLFPVIKIVSKKINTI